MNENSSSLGPREQESDPRGASRSANHPAGGHDFALLGGLVGPSLVQVQEGLRPRVVPRGLCLYEAGDRASELFMVESGEIEIFAPAPVLDGGEVILWRLGRGASFGDMPLLDILPHAHTARASCNTTLWVLPYRYMLTIYSADAEAFTLFMMNVAREAARRARQLSTDLCAMAMARTRASS